MPTYVIGTDVISVEEAQPSRSLTAGQQATETVTAHVLGTTSEVNALAAVKLATYTVFNGLVRQEITLEEVADSVWTAKIKYGMWSEKEPGDYSISFDTTGGKAKILQSKQNIANYAPAGQTAPDFKGAIGVTDDSVEGCEIVVPSFKWTEKHQLAAASVTWSYSQTLRALTGKTNQAAFRGFDLACVLFHGAQGSLDSKTPGIVEMTFTFEAEVDATNLPIGDITVSSKKAWEYLWTRYKDSEDTTAKQMVKRPTSAHVERVYYTADFTLLGIGS